MINVFEYYPWGYIEGGYYFFTRSSNAGIIRVRVLFEGGSYLRKYGIYILDITGGIYFNEKMKLLFLLI